MLAIHTPEGYFLRLAEAGLRGVRPPELPAEVDEAAVLQVARAQKMTALTFVAVAKLRNPPEATLLDAWRAEFLTEVMRTEIQRREGAEVVKLLTDNGVRILPLKGFVLQELYPDCALRSMSDVDLLYRLPPGESPDKVERLLTRHGWHLHTCGTGCHDIFSKDPANHLEMHHSLVMEGMPGFDVLDTIWIRALPDAQNPNLHHMTAEDFYLHTVIHAAKHFEVGGIGVRIMADLAVMRRTMKIDRPAVMARLRECRLEAFAAKLEALSAMWFQAGPDAEDEEAEAFCFSGGVYGDRGTPESWNLGRNFLTDQPLAVRKLLYALRRIFPSRVTLKPHYPKLLRSPAGLPMAWALKWLEVLCCRPRRIGVIFRQIGQVPDDEVCAAQTARAAFGMARHE